jgi:hypothetical protein
VQAFTKTKIGSMTNGPLYIAEPHYQTLGKPGQPSKLGILGMGSGAVKLKWEVGGCEHGEYDRAKSSPKKNSTCSLGIESFLRVGAHTHSLLAAMAERPSSFTGSR